MQRIPLYVCALVVSAAFAAASSPANAAVILLDDFNRATQPSALLGSTPNTGGTWTITGTSVVNPLTVNGSVLPMANTGQDAFSAFSQSVPNAVGNLLITSADINVTSIGAGLVGDYFMNLSDPPATNTTAFFQRLFIRPSGAGFQIGLLDTSGGTTTYGSAVLNFGQAYNVDVAWTFVAGPTNDTFAVTVDNLPYLTHNWTSPTAEPAQISSFNLRQGGGAAAPVLTVDNVQVDATIVIPEPASLALITLGALARSLIGLCLTPSPSRTSAVLTTVGTAVFCGDSPRISAIELDKHPFGALPYI